MNKFIAFSKSSRLGILLNKTNYHKNFVNSSVFNQSRCSIHTSFRLEEFYEPDRRGGYESKIPEKEKLSLKENIKDFQKNIKDMKSQFALLGREFKETLEGDHLIVKPGDMDKKWQFRTEEDLKDWHTICDQDYNEGYSSASLAMSATGRAQFSGVLNTQVPKDGQNHYSGFCAMRSYPPKMSFHRQTVHDWSSYTHLEIKCRGDGRTYAIVISTPGYFDITWFDTYTYNLYTRGGPYWQVSRIPFSKFYWSAKGRVQDKQTPIVLDNISTIGFTLADKTNAPFNLEIDYIGLYSHPTHKERFAYELYKMPHPFYAQN